MMKTKYTKCLSFRFRHFSFTYSTHAPLAPIYLRIFRFAQMYAQIDSPYVDAHRTSIKSGWSGVHFCVSRIKKNDKCRFEADPENYMGWMASSKCWATGNMKSILRRDTPEEKRRNVFSGFAIETFRYFVMLKVLPLDNGQRGEEERLQAALHRMIQRYNDLSHVFYFQRCFRSAFDKHTHVNFHIPCAHCCRRRRVTIHAQSHV